MIEFLEQTFQLSKRFKETPGRRQIYPHIPTHKGDQKEVFSILILCKEQTKKRFLVTLTGEHF